MSYRFTAKRDEKTNNDNDPGFLSEWEPELKIFDPCCVIYKNWFGRYQIKETRVYAFWFTNIWGWKFTNGWYAMADEYGKTVFAIKDIQKAVEICEKKNRMRKVKIVRE